MFVKCGKMFTSLTATSSPVWTFTPAKICTTTCKQPYKTYIEEFKTFINLRFTQIKLSKGATTNFPSKLKSPTNHKIHLLSHLFLNSPNINYIKPTLSSSSDSRDLQRLPSTTILRFTRPSEIHLLYRTTSTQIPLVNSPSTLFVIASKIKTHHEIEKSRLANSNAESIRQ